MLFPIESSDIATPADHLRCVVHEFEQKWRRETDDSLRFMLGCLAVKDFEKRLSWHRFEYVLLRPRGLPLVTSSQADRCMGAQ